MGYLRLKHQGLSTRWSIGRGTLVVACLCTNDGELVNTRGVGELGMYIRATSLDELRVCAISGHCKFKLIRVHISTHATNDTTWGIACVRRGSIVRMRNKAIS